VDRNVKWVLENRGENPGIVEGDMFLGNDPWIGANHQSDVVVICPVFWEGRLLCWVGAAMHTTDVGGSTPGGFCPDAESVYDEPLPTPPVKYVENGEIRRDVEDLFLRRSRFPDLLRLDLLALIASNNVAKQRVLELVGRYGVQTIVGSMQKVIDDSERAFRARMAKLPDGEWSHHLYVDVAGPQDRGLYQLRMRLRKEGDRLIFDNEGTHAQAGALNTTAGSCRSAILSVINPLVCWDMMYATGGPMRLVTFQPVPGTILSASHPGSVSNSSVGVLVAISLATVCISKMLASSEDPELRRRAMGVTAAMFPVSIISGLGRDGTPYGTMNVDPMGGGLGAFPFRDGVDTGGQVWDPISLMPNIEFAEQYFPVLYLYRRELADSGGAGAFRGGNGGIFGLTPHKVDGMIVDVATSGVAVPISEGVLGGLPGCTNGARRLTGIDLEAVLADQGAPTSVAGLGGTIDELGPKIRNLPLAEGDVFELWWNGGGGFGDPLARDPELVAADVAEGAVSELQAREVYGVALADGALDTAATRELRRGQGIDADAVTHADAEPIPVFRASDDAWLCPGCDSVLGYNRPGGYLSETVVHDHTLEELTPLNRDPKLFVDADVTFRSHACGTCGRRVEAYLTVPEVADLAPDTQLATADGRRD
jgi:N-methylhydantoinase B